MSGEAFNVGIKNGNFTIKDLADAAKKVIPSCEVIYTNEHLDFRTYKISFKKFLLKLKDYYKPQYSLEHGGNELVEFFNSINFDEKMFRGNMCNRLQMIQTHLSNNIINKKLYHV